MEVKKCTKCSEEKLASEFSRDSKTQDGLRPWCRSCDSASGKKRRQKAKTEGKCYGQCGRPASKGRVECEECIEAKRWRDMKRRYGLSKDGYLAKYEAQLARCMICREVEMPGEAYLVVDHDHETGQVRDLLCQRCNKILGFVRECPDTTVKVAEGLKKYIVRWKNSKG